MSFQFRTHDAPSDADDEKNSHGTSASPNSSVQA